MREASPHALDTCLGVSGPHDFAVRFDIARPTISTRPSHPAPNTRDDREAPLFSGTGRRELVEMICPTGITKYFSQQDWTAQISLNPLAKLDFAREQFASRCGLRRRPRSSLSCPGRAAALPWRCVAEPGPINRRSVGGSRPRISSALTPQAARRAASGARDPAMTRNLTPAGCAR